MIRRSRGGAALLAVAIGALTLTAARRLTSGESPSVTLPAPSLDQPLAAVKGEQTAVFSGGCFWGIQAVFEHLKGVTSAVAGYSGGTAPHPSYEQVSTGTTGYAESVKVTYDSSQISYGQLLQVFFSVAHDPTELNRQGPDSGPSYRSEIFFTSPAQERVARAYVAQLDKAKIFSRPIATKIEPMKGFYPAEDYHQDFLIHNPTYPYIVRNDLPKIAALKRVYPDLYRETPVMVSSVR